MKLRAIGIDLAKDVFDIHGVDEHGKVLMQKRVSRRQLLGTLSKVEPCLVGMEACASAHYWSREIERLGTQRAADEPAVREALSLPETLAVLAQRPSAGAGGA
jgi:transposase